ncbi:MAG: hypothetical protein IKK51_09325 [Oscillospiraceae bacterium]|nr:hypothetical protein [Oscillospiraceae bacterium]MBR4102060.1 hypothetical protein [Oscillospiraceae bacterium]MBR6617518.1 hypothetical protein [Oscillospiraceae bacterium]
MAKTTRKNEKSGFFFRLMLRVAGVLFVIFCVVSIVNTQNSTAEKKQELAKIEADIEEMKMNIDELNDMNRSDDINRYMEKLAVENNNYAYPDERRYYDTSRD